MKTTPDPSVRSGFIVLLSLCLFVLPVTLRAQNAIEMFANGYTGVPPNGPSATVAANLLLDPAPGFPPGSPVGVTATLSNQQYAGVGTGPGSPVVLFGGRRADGTTNINTTPVFDEMNTIAVPINSQFSSAPNGASTGIDVTQNFSFAVYSSIQHWEGLAVPATNSRTYVADLTLTFSSAVTDPYLHFVGMGGFVGSLGYATELTLTTPGVSLTRLRGNTAFVVSGSQINNGNGGAISTNCDNNTAGCGTVRVNGTGITTLVFQLFIRGDGGTPTWSVPNSNEGDFWMLGVSVPLAPTAADVSVGGRARAANGRAIAGARVTLQNSTGQTRSAITNPFGYYRFDNLEAGEGVVITIASKRHTFQDPVHFITPGDNALDLDFVADN